MTRRPQSAITRSYNRLAAGYDLFNRPMEWFRLTDKRRRLLTRARGRMLEVGVGTGSNPEHYPAEVELTGIDVAEGMLARARRRAAKRGREAYFEQADVQQLPYADGSFEIVARPRA